MGRRLRRMVVLQKCFASQSNPDKLIIHVCSAHKQPLRSCVYVTDTRIIIYNHSFDPSSSASWFGMIFIGGWLAAAVGILTLVDIKRKGTAVAGNSRENAHRFCSCFKNATT